MLAQGREAEKAKQELAEAQEKLTHLAESYERLKHRLDDKDEQIHKLRAALQSAQAAPGSDAEEGNRPTLPEIPPPDDHYSPPVQQEQPPAHVEPPAIQQPTAAPKPHPPVKLPQPVPKREPTVAQPASEPCRAGNTYNPVRSEVVPRDRPVHRDQAYFDYLFGPAPERPRKEPPAPQPLPAAPSARSGTYAVSARDKQQAQPPAIEWFGPVQGHSEPAPAPAPPPVPPIKKAVGQEDVQVLNVVRIVNGQVVSQSRMLRPKP